MTSNHDIFHQISSLILTGGLGPWLLRFCCVSDDGSAATSSGADDTDVP
jgi:hypothetical protein